MIILLFAMNLLLVNAALAIPEVDGAIEPRACVMCVEEGLSGSEAAICQSNCAAAILDISPQVNPQRVAARLANTFEPTNLAPPGPTGPEPPPPKF